MSNVLMPYWQKISCTNTFFILSVLFLDIESHISLIIVNLCMLKVHLKKGENREPYINALRFIVKFIKIDSASCLVTSVSGFVPPILLFDRQWKPFDDYWLWCFSWRLVTVPQQLQAFHRSCYVIMECKEVHYNRMAEIS